MSLAKTCLKTNLSKCSTIDEPGQYQCIVIWEWTSCTKATAGGVVLQHGCIVPHLSKCVVQATHARHISTYQHIIFAPLGLRGGIPRASWEANVVQGPCSRSPAPICTVRTANAAQRRKDCTWSTFSDYQQLQSSHPKVWHIDHSLLECLYPSCVAHTLFGAFAVNKARFTLRILEWKNMQHNTTQKIDKGQAIVTTTSVNYVSNQLDVQLPMISVFATHHHGKSCPIKSTNIVRQNPAPLVCLVFLHASFHC